MLHHHEAGWANPRVLLILGLVFLCGVAVGGAVMRTYVHWRTYGAHTFIYQGKVIDFDTLRTKLNLSADQEQTVKQALDEYAKYYQNLEEQREDVTETGRRRISGVLTPDQKRRFAALLEDPVPAKTP